MTVRRLSFGDSCGGARAPDMSRLHVASPAFRFRCRCIGATSMSRQTKTAGEIVRLVASVIARKQNWRIGAIVSRTRNW